MKPFIKYTLIGLLVVVVAGVSVVGIASAQEDPPRPHEALAELLGLTEAELRDQIGAGISLEDLAADAGVDLDQFWQTIEEARKDNFLSRIQTALTNGAISKDRYNWMMEGFEKGFMGAGHGPGGFFGRGGFESDDGSRPFGGRDGFGPEGKPFGNCARDRLNQ